MKLEMSGKIYTALMALYFFISGLSVLFDIDSKLTRISLNATNQDGEIAFILIYCGLMVGIGMAISIIAYISKSWVYSAVLAVTIIFSFILFRLVGASLVGELSKLQISFLLTEIVEFSLGLFLILKSSLFKKRNA